MFYTDSRLRCGHTSYYTFVKPLRELGRIYLGATRRTNQSVLASESSSEPSSGLPLLQVWPSDSPRGEADGQAFTFPDVKDSISDSGIDSVQVSPSPTCTTGGVSATCTTSATSPTIATTPQDESRRPSLLHPDHARLKIGLHHHHHHHHHHGHHKDQGSPVGAGSGDEDADLRQPVSPSSSTTGSLRSVPSSVLHSVHERRRSSRYSMFDALDLEYALLRAAARGSVGPYSLSESLHKLTFTQSLAFPALARGLASKQQTSSQHHQNHQQHRSSFDGVHESGLNACAKVVTAVVLVLVSVMLFGVVYKFSRT
ncbi:hypothetical protein QAD02_020022 [Eretmocerus hayati]|uniref:Uncharacterized protein n=1 Tax=Eretmocerus hayati TaxID=131215 RepID=A0ACC2PLD8_9HYME|nr:hypothetical protein QAD02_020022 [Eretmocerus hayati]